MWRSSLTKNDGFYYVGQFEINFANYFFENYE